MRSAGKILNSIATIVFCLAASVILAQPVEIAAPAGATRTTLSFDDDWLFSLGDFLNATAPAFDDSAWRKLDLPHDWSIEQPFDPNLASCTAFLPGGIGWYRKHFRADASLRGKDLTIEFDGIYNHSEIWLNGFLIGGRPCGYSSFECDLTPYLKFDGTDNVIAVRVDHSRFADSRWYTGSGIYRHVRLRITDELHIATWGTFVTASDVGSNSAVIQVSTTITNGTDAAAKISIESEIVAPDGRVIGNWTSAGTLESKMDQTVIQKITVAHPQLWSLENPLRYTLRSRLNSDSNAVDETSTTFGVRTLRFDPDKGFFLNGAPMKIKGVCIHHDAGCLGAAVPEKVLERRLRSLKDIGVNAIRTSHNPPAPELLDLCDRLGLLVMEEAFDEFTPAKNKWMSGWNSGTPARFGYSEDFDLWSARDVRDMVRRDRNHPSVIMWSIGNEIDYPNDPFSDPALGGNYRPENPSAKYIVNDARPLIAAVKEEDSTRPVTMALASLAMSDAVGLPALLDIAGYNYQEARYAADHARYPRRVIFGSETSQRYEDWAIVRDNDYVAGQFLWTGIDYLGEAGHWPDHGSATGLLDLCGFKKPLGWFRQSLWSDRPMVYLCASSASQDGSGRRRRGPLESWNWASNSEVSVRCFTTCPEVQLLVNGRVISTRQRPDAVNGALNWTIPFEPGEIKAIGKNAGKTLCEFVLKTAGKPERIELLAETNAVHADGRDICHVEFRVVDSRGVRVPDAENRLQFTIAGPAKIIGLENGNLERTEPYGTEKIQAYHGRGLAILQSKRLPGKIVLQATSPGLAPAEIAVRCD
ncbi:MAG TPA: glycoside hydrolase family 2 TIM barrel-domain containing protein [Verrucomicrobiae bacterium]|nr:glycoside hydrolase family 2 TIM barrel-domain containing protein [Verrucomicrobiae bacterium]